MQFLEHMYISDNISEDERRIRDRLRGNKAPFYWFVIVLSTTRDGLLDIISVSFLRHKWLADEDVCVIGVAKGYVHALYLMEKIVQDVYKVTGDCSLKEYFSECMENDKEEE